MPEYFSPGVYVEEVDKASRSITGVGTSTAGFVGMAEKGPAGGAPTLVTNFKSFLRQFGGFLSEYTHGENRYLAPSVEQFFANGGTRCYIARVIPDDAAKASKKVGILSVEAANEGKWGNRIQVSLKSVEGKKMQLLKKEGDTIYTAKSTEGFVEGDIVIFNGEYNRITLIYDNQVTFESKFKGNPVDEAMIPKTFLQLVTFDATIRYNDQIEEYFDLTLNRTATTYIVTRLSKSELVTLTAEDVKESKQRGEKGEPMQTVISNPVEAILGKGVTSGAFTLEGGSDGTISSVNAGTFIGQDDGPNGRTGIQAFVENSNVNLMAVPGITIPEVGAALISHCENLKDRFAVLDMPFDMTKIEDMINFRSVFDSTYAAIYHPWIQVFDRSAGKEGFVPPSGAVLGAYARTDAARGVHKAPANEPLICSGLSVAYTREEQDLLNPEGINLIRQIPGEGIRIWGARTASGNGAFRYVNIRRLFIYAMESVKRSTNWVVFEPNDETLWQRVYLTITNFLETMWRGGMLAGSSMDEAFFVEIGPGVTMNANDIREGRLICNIGIAPSRPAEFVIFRLSQMTSEGGGEG